jgi:hypothetical protein
MGKIRHARCVGDELTIEMVDDEGDAFLTVTVHKPTFHALLIDYLMRFEEEVTELESGPRHPMPVLQFPRRRSGMRPPK